MPARWTLTERTADAVTLTRPETLTVHVGDHVDLKRDKRWGGGNRARVIELRPGRFLGEVSAENRRLRNPNPTKLGEFEVPYTAIEGRIY